MKTDDYELQKNIEANIPVDQNDADAKAYQRVFKALTQTPEISLSPDFSDRIVQKIVATKTEKESLRDYWLIGFGAFFLLLAFVATVVISFAYLDFKPTAGFLSGIGEYKWLLALAFILIIIFNRIEKRLFSKNPDLSL